MSNFLALLLTLLTGIFFVIGFLLVKKSEKKEELSILANGLALAVMLGIVFFDLIPEITEASVTVFTNKWIKIFLILLFMGIGMGLLKAFDHFIPAHHHKHKEKEKQKEMEEHKSHSYHIGVILSISLVLHNILEGMSLYIIAKESFASGIFMAIGIGLHNLPMGIEIASNLELSKKKEKAKYYKLALIFSTFVGGLFLFIIGNNITGFLLFMLLSIATGMILYISLFELLKEVMNYRKEKLTYLGIAVGICLVIALTFIGGE